MLRLPNWGGILTTPFDFCATDSLHTLQNCSAAAGQPSESNTSEPSVAVITFNLLGQSTLHISKASGGQGVNGAGTGEGWQWQGVW